MSNLKNWKAALLLSLIIPVGFLTTFKLTGLLSGPTAIAETKTLEPIKWEFEKPFESTDEGLWFYDCSEVYVNNSYVDNSAMVTLAAIPTDYIVNYAQYDDSTFLDMNLYVKANVVEGFVDNVRIFFREGYNMSLVRWMSFSDPYFTTAKNLQVKNYADGFQREWLLDGDLKAFVEANGANHMKEALFSARGVEWILMASENVSQQLEVTAEVTYFNGASYIKIVLPILLSLIADVGNTLETARTITPGNYTASVSATYDNADYYRIRMARGHTVELQALVGKYFPTAVLSLYDPLKNLRANATLERFYMEPKLTDRITCAIDMEGYWYIKMESLQDNGIYRLMVEAEGS